MGAFLIDRVLLLIVFAIVGGAMHAQMNPVPRSGTALLVFCVLYWAYFTICEAASGQTLGKMLVNIRVVNATGQKPSLGQAAIRNLLRFLDELPVLYIIGFISIAATGENRRQRVGDIAARTLVVRGDPDL